MFGLLTRLAVLPMLALTLLFQLHYQQLDTHLFWMVLLGWLAVHGAGRLSLDHGLRHGLAASAVPFAAGMLSTVRWLEHRLGPVYQLAVRLWIAAA